MHPRKIEEGDLVQLATGGPVMSVQEISGKRARCMWFDDDGKLVERYVLIAMLRLVPSDTDPQHGDAPF